MSLNPSNAISKRITGRDPFTNVAGMGKVDPDGVDAALGTELGLAGITVEHLPETLRYGEAHTSVVGDLHGWRFRRAWYYWVVEGAGIPLEDATKLHEAHGKSVRVHGHCGCPSPLEWCKGFPVTMYHVDNQEGLNALADTIRAIYARGQEKLKEQKHDQAKV